MNDYALKCLHLRRQFYTPLISDIFTAHTIPLVWGLALAATESEFRTDAINLIDPGDIARGGSYGLFQMSYQTARGLGFKGEPLQLLDPAICTEWTARLLSDNAQRVFGAVGRANLKDIAALHNSGKIFANAPRSTRVVYVPRVLAWADDFDPKHI